MRYLQALLVAEPGLDIEDILEDILDFVREQNHRRGSLEPLETVSMCI